MTIPPDAFASRLDAARAAAGLSWGELARRAGLSREAVRLLARGERAPSFDTACRLARALQISVADLNVLGTR